MLSQGRAGDTDAASRAGDSGMSALIVGPAFFNYNEAIGSAFQKAGYRVRIVGSPVHNPSGLWNRISIDFAGKFGIVAFRQAWRRRFNRLIGRADRDMRPDFMLVIKGDWLDPAVFEACTAARKVIWFQDAAFRCGPDHLRLAQLADAVFVFEATDIDYFANAGIDTGKVRFLPMGYDDTVYKPLDMNRDIDVSFVGKMYPQRKALLADLVRDLPGVRFEIWGRFVRYQEPRTWWEWVRVRSDARLRRIYRNKDIPPQRVNLLYNQSKIVLNMHHDQSKDGCNPRVFEIAGSGAFQICDDNGFVRTQVSDAIVQFQNYGDLIEKIEAYLSDDAGRKRVSQVSLSAMKTHTFAHRIDQMLSMLK